MFARWGKFVYRRRRWVAALALLVAATSFGFASRVSSVLTTGGWYDPSSESQQVAQRLASDFGQGGSSIVVLFQAPGRTDATSAAFQADVTAALSGLRSDRRVTSFVGFPQTGDSRFISTGGDATWVLVDLNLNEDQAISAVDALRSEIATPPGFTVQMTGNAPLSAATSAQSENDLARAESISLPIALFILILVFGSLIAAGLPLLVAGLTIPSTLAIVWVIAQHTTMSIFVTSVVTMLGLALAIDYSLFMVSRFREELACGATVEEAIERTVATSGKAVAFSGSAVAIGLSGLLLFRAPTLSSMGIGGALIALCSVAYALTFLPATLSILGPRVERLRVPNPFRRPASAAGTGSTYSAAPARAGWWERIASAVMARPVAVLLPVLALLLAFGVPFLGERPGLPGADVLPATAEARAAWDTIETQSPAGETRPIDLLVTVQGNPLSGANATALADYSARLATLAGVARVDGPFSLTDKNGQQLATSAVAAVVSAPSGSRPAALNAALASTVRASTVHLQVVSPLAGSAAGQALVQTIRGIAPGAGITIAVGGDDASSLDFLNAQNSELPVAIVFILIAMALMLMLQFGSVVLPLKAVVMTMLSLTASFGALVWIFQDGNLSGVLGFVSPGFTVAIVPILMFSLIFGLSMDYEVLLVSRIQESYRKTGDTSRAVAEGLSRTGRVITGAALIMVSVFAAFGLADQIVIKSIGVGMAIAVLIDATIIRVLLVPATMRLLGSRAWWAPSRLSGISGRLGFSHTEVDYECDAPEPGSKPRDDGPGRGDRPGRLAGPPAPAAG
ncbi:MAG: MMPL family transporter [Candidatus Limnocylindrales bacterium]|jgi:RND superfamily putative drug exporter